MKDMEKAFVKGITSELEKLGTGGVVSQLYRTAKANPLIAGIVIGHLATRAGRGLKKLIRGTRE